MADLIDWHDTALVTRGAISDTLSLDTRETCTQLPKAGKLEKRTAGLAGFDDNIVIEHDDVWYIRGNTFLAASEPLLKAGQKAKVYNLSGCSAIFAIRADGKPDIFHITAGRETTLAKSAATYLQAQEKTHKLTPKTIVVYTREGGTTNYNDIVRALGADLAKLVTHKKYGYNPATAPRTERWQLVLTVGTTDIEAREYDGTKCGTGHK